MGQTSAETSSDTDQLGLFSYSQICIEQHQLSTMKHNGYCFVPLNSQMASNTEEMSSLSDVTARDCSSHVARELFGWSVCTEDTEDCLYEANAIGI
ncbi:hypothetical protein N665_1361s0003 [Sinapis alba]|nr:hypothetical protein N665_1361s0003 [Sinapis alba]